MGRELTNRLVRPGCRVMKLDAGPAQGRAILPKAKKKRAERQELYKHMVRIGQVSMIPIGPDTYRTPNRGERRKAGIRSTRIRSPLIAIAQRRGVA